MNFGFVYLVLPLLAHAVVFQTQPPKLKDLLTKHIVNENPLPRATNYITMLVKSSKFPPPDTATGSQLYLHGDPENGLPGVTLTNQQEMEDILEILRNKPNQNKRDFFDDEIDKVAKEEGRPYAQALTFTEAVRQKIPYTFVSHVWGDEMQTTIETALDQLKKKPESKYFYICTISNNQAFILGLDMAAELKKTGPKVTNNQNNHKNFAALAAASLQGQADASDAFLRDVVSANGNKGVYVKDAMMDGALHGVVNNAVSFVLVADEAFSAGKDAQSPPCSRYLWNIGELEQETLLITRLQGPKKLKHFSFSLKANLGTVSGNNGKSVEVFDGMWALRRLWRWLQCDNGSGPPTLDNSFRNDPNAEECRKTLVNKNRKKEYVNTCINLKALNAHTAA